MCIKSLEKNLIEELLPIPKDCPKDLERYWKEEEYWTFTLITNALKKNIKEAIMSEARGPKVVNECLPAL